MKSSLKESKCLILHLVNLGKVGRIPEAGAVCAALQGYKWLRREGRPDVQRLRQEGHKERDAKSVSLESYQAAEERKAKSDQESAYWESQA